MLASRGIGRVPVYQRPTVAVIPCGRGIVSTGRKLKKGLRYEVNSHTVSAIVHSSGGDAYIFAPLEERADVMRGTIAEALRFDLIIVAGGTTGEASDSLRGVLRGWGEMLFESIMVSSGESTMLAIVEGKPLLIVPGDPVPCLVITHALGARAIGMMARMPEPAEWIVAARLAHEIRQDSKVLRFVAGRLGKGRTLPLFEPLGENGALANIDGYVEVSEKSNALEKGQRVAVRVFQT
jgi:molybdopterin biosynthesis enzyme